MLTTYATGIGTIVLVMLAWVAVQAGWRRVFADVCHDPDVLAGRSGCHGCKRHDACRRTDRQCNKNDEEGVR